MATPTPATPANPNASFVEMQLTPEGAALAGGGSLTISGPRRTLTFVAGEQTQVERSFEYPWLRDHTINGEYIFELVPSQPVLVPAPPRLPGGSSAASTQGAPYIGPLVDVPADEQTGKPEPEPQATSEASKEPAK